MKLTPELKAAFEDDSLTGRQIADKFNISLERATTVRSKYRKEAGLPRLPYRNRAPEGTTMTNMQASIEAEKIQARYDGALIFLNNLNGTANQLTHKDWAVKYALGAFGYSINMNNSHLKQ